MKGEGAPLRKHRLAPFAVKHWPEYNRMVQNADGERTPGSVSDEVRLPHPKAVKRIHEHANDSRARKISELQAEFESGAYYVDTGILIPKLIRIFTID